MNEIWKDILGYEGLYQVSNLGRVKRTKYKTLTKNKILNFRVHKSGYLEVELSLNGNRKVYKVHRLVAEAFLSNPNNLSEINHKDENKQNNKVNNLEWCTHKYNMNYGTIKERLSKQINQYTLNDDLIKVWSGAAEASRVLRINRGNISSCCMGILQTAGGYKWRYYDL